jgi:hypothetical protein
MNTAPIPGYRLGDPALPPSTISPGDFDRIAAAALFTGADRQALREAREAVAPHVEELLDVWYGFVGSQPFLLDQFSTQAGPEREYLARVRGRFGQWVLDTLDANFDESWLAWQAEVGRRHARGKNATDGVRGAPAFVPYRYLPALIYPIYATMRPFLEPAARDTEHLERMHQAWLKAVIISVALWSEPYIAGNMF